MSAYSLISNEHIRLLDTTFDIDISRGHLLFPERKNYIYFSSLAPNDGHCHKAESDKDDWRLIFNGIVRIGTTDSVTIEEVALERRILPHSSLYTGKCKLSMTSETANVRFSSEYLLLQDTLSPNWFHVCSFKDLKFIYHSLHIELDLLVDNTPHFEIDQLTLMSDQFHQLFLSQDACDVTFILGQEKIMAHSVILTTRVPYYKKLLSSGMKESHSREIEINGISAEVFKALLKFIYSAKLPLKLENIAQELMLAADLYDIESLKQACCKNILLNLRVDNLVETLVFFHTTSFKDGERLCLDRYTIWWPEIDEEKLKPLKEYPELMMQVHLKLKEAAKALM